MSVTNVELGTQNWVPTGRTHTSVKGPQGKQVRGHLYAPLCLNNARKWS
uniref:Uncharacterized protein n=1 Tax=Anguilla anguilla TaxID=7936 RepID=A0A0E9W564_ANGAN